MLVQRRDIVRNVHVHVKIRHHIECNLQAQNTRVKKITNTQMRVHTQLL